MRIIITFLLNLLVLGAFAQKLSLQTIQMSHENESYVELHSYIESQSLKSVLIDSNYSSQLDVLVLFKQGEEIVQFDKFRMSFLAERPDENFYDIKRYVLVPGEYQLEVSYQDVNEKDNPEAVSIQKDIVVLDENGPQLSDILLLQNIEKDSTSPLAKHGLVMEALPYQACPASIKRVIAYLEVYELNQTPEDQQFYLEYGIRNGNDDVLVKSYKKLKKSALNPVVLQLSLDQISTGDYRFYAEIRNQEKDLIYTKESYFRRDFEPTAEDYTLDFDSLFVSKLSEAQVWYSVASLFPIIPDQHHELLQTMIDKQELKSTQVFLYSFWASVNAEDPEKVFTGYDDLVRSLDAVYGYGGVRGYESDRGYIYLKYGSPSDIFPMDNELDAPPYEIWLYNDFPRTGQNGVKFLFYNPALDNRNFILLHGTALNESQNPQWQRILYSKTPEAIEGNYHDSRTVSDGLTRFAVDMFNDF